MCVHYSGWLIRILQLGAFSVASFGAEPLHVSEAQAKHVATSKPIPTISPLARNLKISGQVEVDVLIDETGKVTEVTPTRGPPVLSAGVVYAVKKWKFKPFADASGAPTAAVTTLRFDFKQ